MIDYVINGIINIIGKRIGYVLLVAVLTISIKLNASVELLIFNLLMINTGLLLLKINDKVL